MTRHLLVVGAGITGLSAAWEASADPTVRVTVLEASDRTGGKIRTSPLRLPNGSLDVDEGADGFLARVPEGTELCIELGIGDRLVHPVAGRAMVWARDRLRPFPHRHVMGIPVDVDDLAATGILTEAGVARVAAEVDSTAPAPRGDVAIGPFLAEHFGRELVDRLVGPLVGGINAGDVEELSLRAVLPQVADAAADGGSLSEALGRRRAPTTPSAPVFNGLPGGTGELTDALAAGCSDRGVDIRTGSPVESLDVTAGSVNSRSVNSSSVTAGSVNSGNMNAGSVIARLADGAEVRGDAAVVATPAFAAAPILRSVAPRAAEELDAIGYCSVALVVFAFDRTALADAGVTLDATGFLVPRDAGLLMTAASWGSSKWAHWDDGSHVILRVSAGHAGDDRGATTADDELVAQLLDDLRTTMGLDVAPVAVRITRWIDAFAQYVVGHLDRADRIDAALAAAAPNVRFTGAAMRGVGIPACIRQGRAAARSLLD